MKNFDMTVKKTYSPPRTRIVCLGGGNVCDQDYSGQLNAASGGSGNGYYNLANTASFGFDDGDSTGGGLWAYE